MRFLAQLSHNLRVIYGAALLRSTGVGLTGVVLGVYLSRAGLSATQIGTVITAGLAGAALGTLVVSLRADRLGRRRILASISLLAALGGLGFALTGRFHALRPSRPNALLAKLTCLALPITLSHAAMKARGRTRREVSTTTASSRRSSVLSIITKGVSTWV